MLFKPLSLKINNFIEDRIDLDSKTTDKSKILNDKC